VGSECCSRVAQNARVVVIVIINTFLDFDWS
jgi:hypothetical protein